MLQVRENDISLRKWFGGTAHAQLRTFIGNAAHSASTITNTLKDLNTAHNKKNQIVNLKPICSDF